MSPFFFVFAFSLTLACDEVRLPLQDLLHYHSPPLLPRQRQGIASKASLKEEGVLWKMALLHVPNSVVFRLGATLHDCAQKKASIKSRFFTNQL